MRLLDKLLRRSSKTRLDSPRYESFVRQASPVALVLGSTSEIRFIYLSQPMDAIRRETLRLVGQDYRLFVGTIGLVCGRIEWVCEPRGEGVMKHAVNDFRLALTAQRGGIAAH
jgi:hypothetical protein